MIVSKVMKPCYEITGTIMKLTTSIFEKLGEVKALILDKLLSKSIPQQ